MNCNNPQFRQVRYRNIKFAYISDKIVVPCGRCEACQAARKSDLYLRSFFQALETIHKGGFIFFETLTYNDQHLPVNYFLRQKSQDYVLLPYPEYRDITAFWKRLRKNVVSFLCKKNGCTLRSSQGTLYQKQVVDNLKYIVCTQFGEKTYRPHYHFCLFCTLPLNNYELKRLINKSWRNVDSVIVDSERHNVFNEHDYGMTDKVQTLSRTGKKMIDYNTITNLDLHAVGYITRYVTRSVDSENYHISTLELADFTEIPKQLRPRVVTSLNLGYNVFLHYDFYKDYFEKQLKCFINFDKMTLRIPSVDKEDSNGFFDCPIPNYYQNKIFFFSQRLPDGTYNRQVREHWQLESDLFKSYLDFRTDNIVEVVEKLAENYHKTFISFNDNIQEALRFMLPPNTDFIDLAVYRILIFGKQWSERFLHLLEPDNLDLYTMCNYLYEPRNVFVQYPDYETAKFDNQVKAIKFNQWLSAHYPNYERAVKMLELKNKNVLVSKDVEQHNLRVNDEIQKSFLGF